MRMSMSFGRTLREVPSGVEVVSHRLLLRAALAASIAVPVAAQS